MREGARNPAGFPKIRKKITCIGEKTRQKCLKIIIETLTNIFWRSTARDGQTRRGRGDGGGSN
jgi:hypothetical protein